MKGMITTKAEDLTTPALYAALGKSLGDLSGRETTPRANPTTHFIVKTETTQDEDDDRITNTRMYGNFSMWIRKNGWGMCTSLWWRKSFSVFPQFQAINI